MPPSEAPAHIEEPQARARVLVADDDPDMRALLFDGLCAHGFDVLLAADGLDMIRQLEVASRAARVHALVTDVRMPLLDGIQAAMHVQAWMQRLPIFLISGFADVEPHAVRGLAITALLPKPVELDDLARRLRVAIRALEVDDR